MHTHMHTQTHTHFMLNLNIKLCNEQMCWRPLQLAEQEVRVQSWGRVDPLEKEMATLSSILAWRIPWTRSLTGYSPWGHKKSDTTKQLTLKSWTLTFIKPLPAVCVCVCVCVCVHGWMGVVETHCMPSAQNTD